ncbi:hypothetical protein [Sphingomonas panaciterrae]|uniref:hypothetical protein n=1 Tax=Sphingomonas panaciterrae TaxID=1462999 RepID=UPI002FEFA96E
MDDHEELNQEKIEKMRASRVFCFVDDAQINGFDRAYMVMMNELRKRQTEMFIDENNVLQYIHGGNWVRPGHDDDDAPAMQTLSSEWTIPFVALADNDLTLIEAGLSKNVEELSGQFIRSIYSVVGAAAEKVGNIVSNKDTGSSAQSLLEMLRKIEFGVDRDGKVSFPQIHVGPDMGEKLLAELEAQPPEFGEEVERVKAERMALALQKEAERKAKFKAPR